MAQFQRATIEKNGPVATVTLNDPESRNMLSPDMISDLMGAFQKIREDDDIKVVVTTGAGDAAWSAGQSGHALVAGYERRAEKGRQGSRMMPLNEMVRNFPKVTIAAVNGYCLGAAITLLISHDLAIASEERARFGLPEVFRGFVPRTPVASIFWAVPRKWAFDMILTGDNWDARTAQMAGLITRVVPHAQLRDAAQQWANEIARWDAVTLEYCKRAAHASLDQPTYLQAIEVAGLLTNEHSVVNPRSHEGMRAFLAKTGLKATQMIKWVR
ncbi:MAG: enoyl-CoA hydratase/isomerase family protein [Chloroflexi bacterium]|nr:enoyl-CoA hydratase/isomerase family protein [Chloroflexota bacterium]